MYVCTRNIFANKRNTKCRLNDLLARKMHCSKYTSVQLFKYNLGKPPGRVHKSTATT